MEFESVRGFFESFGADPIPHNVTSSATYGAMRAVASRQYGEQLHTFVVEVMKGSQGVFRLVVGSWEELEDMWNKHIEKNSQ